MDCEEPECPLCFFLPDGDHAGHKCKSLNLVYAEQKVAMENRQDAIKDEIVEL